MPRTTTALIYGVTGYTGRLIAERAVAEGMRPIFAGRNRQAVEQLAQSLEVEHRVFDLVDPHRVAQSLEGVAAVLNCAGPFSRTARVMIEACLAAGTHYLDITGEIDVIEHAAGQHERALAAGVALLPAVGFDVVPSDCLAAMLAERLPGGKRLELAFSGTGALSRGTARTLLEGLPSGGRVREDGKIKRVPVAHLSKRIAFRGGRKWSMAIPWGDVASAYYSTGIPNITVFVAAPRSQIVLVRRARWLLPLARMRAMQWLLGKLIDRRVKGPDAEERKRQRSSFWGRVTDAAGNTASATLETQSGYDLTVTTAVEVLRRAAAGQIGPGFATPSKALGSQFILSIPGSDFAWAN